MNFQQSLFEDIFPEPSNTNPSLDNKIRILPPKGQNLGKTQQTFNRLVTRVERLRNKLATLTTRLDAALAAYSTQLHPLKRQETELRKKIVRYIYPFFKKRIKPPLGKQQQKTLKELISNNLTCIINEEGSLEDPDLKEIFATVEGISVEEAEKQDIADACDEFENIFSSMGIDIDLSEFTKDMSPEAQAIAQRKILEQFQTEQERMQGKANTTANGNPRKKTKKQLEKEAREHALEEARKRSIGSIYKQLARVFHPDLEPDLARRAEKEELMKELTAAYKSGDLHSLLRLELTWIRREEGDLSRLTDEKLEIYNDILKEQIQDLEMECQQVQMHPRYEVLQEFCDPFEPVDSFDAKREMARVQARITSLEDTVEKLQGQNAESELRSLIRLQLAIAKENQSMGNEFDQLMKAMISGRGMR